MLKHLINKTDDGFIFTVKNHYSIEYNKSNNILQIITIGQNLSLPDVSINMKYKSIVYYNDDYRIVFYRSHRNNYTYDEGRGNTVNISMPSNVFTKFKNLHFDLLRSSATYSTSYPNIINSHINSIVGFKPMSFNFYLDLDKIYFKFKNNIMEEILDFKLDNMFLLITTHKHTYCLSPLIHTRVSGNIITFKTTYIDNLIYWFEKALYYRENPPSMTELQMWYDVEFSSQKMLCSVISDEF